MCVLRKCSWVQSKAQVQHLLETYTRYTFALMLLLTGCCKWTVTRCPSLAVSWKFMPLPSTWKYTLKIKQVLLWVENLPLPFGPEVCVAGDILGQNSKNMGSMLYRFSFRGVILYHFWIWSIFYLLENSGPSRRAPPHPRASSHSTQTIK